MKTHTVPVLRLMVHAWKVDRVMGLAAEVAFWSVLSLFPALLAMAATLGWLDTIVGTSVADDAETALLDAFNGILTDDADEIINDLEHLFTKASPRAAVIGVFGALWTASRGFAAIIRALDVAYNLEEKRSFLVTRALAVGMAVGSVLIGGLMLTVIVVGPLLGSGQELAGGTFGAVWDSARWPVAFAAMVTWATTVLHIAPNHTTPWRWDLPGAVLTTVLWGTFSFGLRYYLQFSGETNQVLGILGGSLIALIWLFLLSIGLLLGGELNAALVQLGIAPPDREALKERLTAKEALADPTPVIRRRGHSHGKGQEPPSESVRPS